MGLLDDPRQAGLLTLGLGLLNSRGSFGNALGSAGQQAYGAMVDASMRQRMAKADEQRQKMLEQQLAMQKLQMEQAQAQAARAEQARKDKANYLGSLDAGPGGMGPTIPFSVPGALGAGFDAETIKLLAPQQKKVARAIQTINERGEPVTQQYDESGAPVGPPIPGWVKPEMVPLGDRVESVVPKPGLNLPVGMSPAGAASAELARETARGTAATRDLNNEIVRQRIAEGKRTADAADLKKKNDWAEIKTTVGTLDKAITHPGRETYTGKSGMLGPERVWGSDAANYAAMHNQIVGKVFLQAYETLKGGGPITDVEGRKAEQGKARMERAQSDEEYLAGLLEFRDAIASAYERMTGEKLPAAPKVGKSATGNQLYDSADEIIRGGR